MFYKRRVRDGYTIEDRCGCILIRGRVPMSKLFALHECAPTGSEYADAEMNYVADTDFLLGRPSCFPVLRQHLADEATARLVERHPETARLSMEARRWLAVGYQDHASAAAFLKTTGIASPLYAKVIRHLDREACPDTHESFRRFCLLIGEVPEVREATPLLREISSRWNNFIGRLDELVEIFEREHQLTDGRPRHALQFDRVLQGVLAGWWPRNNSHTTAWRQ